MSRAPTTRHARAIKAFVLGQIDRADYMNCVTGRAWINRGFVESHEWNRFGRRCRNMERLKPIGTFLKKWCAQ